MRLSLLAPLLFVANIAAAPVDTTQTDATVISRAAAEVITRLKLSIPAVKSIANTALGMDLSYIEREIERKAQDVSQALSYGAQTVRRGPDITLAEATSLLSTFNELERLTDQSTQAYVDAKRVVIRTQGGREAILRILNDHLAASGAFGDALKAKMPAVGSVVGTLYTERAAMEIRRAIDTYKRA